MGAEGDHNGGLMGLEAAPEEAVFAEEEEEGRLPEVGRRPRKKRREMRLLVVSATYLPERDSWDGRDS